MKLQPLAAKIPSNLVGRISVVLEAVLPLIGCMTMLFIWFILVFDWCNFLTKSVHLAGEAIPRWVKHVHLGVPVGGC